MLFTKKIVTTKELENNSRILIISSIEKSDKIEIPIPGILQDFVTGDFTPDGKMFVFALTDLYQNNPKENNKIFVIDLANPIEKVELELLKNDTDLRILEVSNKHFIYSTEKGIYKYNFETKQKTDETATMRS